MKNKRDIPQCIRDAVNKSGMRVSDIAKISGISKAYIHQLMNGDALPSLATTISLCHAFGITIDGLLDGMFPDINIMKQAKAIMAIRRTIKDLDGDI